MMIARHVKDELKKETAVAEKLTQITSTIAIVIDQQE